MLLPLLLLSAGSIPVADTNDDRGDLVIICPVHGDILDGISVLVDRAVKQEAVGAKAIVFSIDTFGGRVDSAMDIANTILESKVPTVAFINGRGAISAGALIAYACDYIVMTPGVNIGASTPVAPGVDMTEEMNEKSMSFLRAKYRALGEEKGHNPLIGEAMVDSSIELYGAQEADDTYRVYKVEGNRVIEHYATRRKSLYREEPPSTELLVSLFAQPSTDNVLRDFPETIRELLDDPVVPTPREPQNGAARQGSQGANSGSPRSIEGLPADARLISPAAKLLTLTTREALEIGLIHAVAETPDAALSMTGFVPFRTLQLEMTWAEAIFSFLTSPMISGLLLLCGIGGIYVEFRTPGLGWPGILGAVCLTLFFGSRLVIGIADWIDLLLVVVGLALLAAEIFVIPGFGIAGISGITCLVVGIYLSLTRVPIPQYTWDFVRLRDAGTSLMLSSLLFIMFMVMTWKVFPRTRLAHGLMLADTQAVTAGYTVQTSADSGAALGLRGKATSMLRPAGRGRFGAKTYDVMTRGEFIAAGTPVEIIQVEGNRYVVRELEEEEQA